MINAGGQLRKLINVARFMMFNIRHQHCDKSKRRIENRRSGRRTHLARAASCDSGSAAANGSQDRSSSSCSPFERGFSFWGWSYMVILLDYKHDSLQMKNIYSQTGSNILFCNCVLLILAKLILFSLADHNIT